MNVHRVDWCLLLLATSAFRARAIAGIRAGCALTNACMLHVNIPSPTGGPAAPGVPLSPALPASPGLPPSPGRPGPPGAPGFPGCPGIPFGPAGPGAPLSPGAPLPPFVASSPGGPGICDVCIHKKHLKGSNFAVCLLIFVR